MDGKDGQKLQQLIDRLNRLEPDLSMRDELTGIHCCRLALDALEQGNYGVAAVLLDSEGEMVAQSENRVFSQGYNSSAHAEMLLLDQLDQGAVKCSPQQLTMLVTLEPCPMCLSRLLLSGIASVRYMVPDPDGGMVKHIAHLPPAWRNLAQLQNHYAAHISGPLKALASDLAEMNLAHLRHKLFMHIRP